ncbi:MAG: patatin-like phospholipase family protein [Candidatus Omnitrophota bacterium]
MRKTNPGLLKLLVILTILFAALANSYGQDEKEPPAAPQTFREFLDNFIVKEYRIRKSHTIKANAVFSGGGVGSLALAGVLYAADEEGIVFKRVGGTSGGAILASLYAAGYNPKEIAQIISETNFKDFVKGDITMPYFVTHIDSLRKNYAYFDNDALYNWIKDLLGKKGVVAFKDLQVPLKIAATDIYHHRRVIFDKESYPDMEVALALKMSSAIPIFFTPVEWTDPLLPAADARCLMLDGSILSTYPSDLFGSFREKDVYTFGFVLVDDERNDVSSINDIVDYVKQIINTIVISHETESIRKASYVYNLTISTGKIRAIQFDISEEDKKSLFDTGYNKMKEYLKNWKKRHF